MTDQLEAVVKDRYDREDYVEAKGQLGDLAAARDRLSEFTEMADEVMADAHAMFLRSINRFVDDVPPVYSVPAAVMRELPNTERYPELRQHTVGDPLMSGMAVTALSHSLRDLFEKIGDEVQEKADRVQEIRDQLDELIDHQPGDPVPDLDGYSSPQAAIDGLSDELAAAQADLDAALADVEPQIGRAVRAASNEAADEVGAAAAAVAAWGQEAAEFARTDPAERIRLMKLMQTDEMRQVAELFGRIRWEMSAVLANSWGNGPTEIHSVTSGNDLSRLLPSELVLLAVDELRPEFFRRFVNRQLRCYQTRERSKEDRGAVVYIMDASTSMGWHGGQRLRWAVAVGLALLSVARAQGRAFHAVVFNGPGAMEEFAFPKPAEFELDKMLAFAAVSASGGTDFMGPLTRGADLCTTDFETTNLEGADLVFVTDGEARVTPEWLTGFTDKRDTAGFRTWGIAVEQAVPQVLTDICELTAPVNDLFSGGDIREIFRRVGQNYQPAHKPTLSRSPL